MDKRTRINTILEWRILQGKTYREIAAALGGITPTGVRWIAMQFGAPRVGSGRRKKKESNNSA